MTHEHLIFDSLDGLQRDTDHDYDRCSADSQALQTLDIAYDKGQDSNYRKEHGAHKGDLVKDLGYKVRGRPSGTEAGDKSAIVL